MGDCQHEDLGVSLDSRLKLKFLGSQVTTDAGLLAYRELDEMLGLTEMAQHALQDSRVGSNMQHRLLTGISQMVRQYAIARHRFGRDNTNRSWPAASDPNGPSVR